MKKMLCNTYFLVFSIMLFVAALTWIVPSGQYDRLEQDGRTYAVAVMIQRTRASYAERMAMMQGVTRAVAAYHEQLPPIAPALARDAPVSTSSRPRQAE